MGLFARLMYRALVWKERQRARLDQRWPMVRSTPRGSSAQPSREKGGTAAHLETGRRGESLAYWYLRQAGYTIVARNRPSRAGELDLVAWEGPILTFVEVKTRTSLEGGQPEAAVSLEKQKRVAKTAKEYMRRMGRRALTYRFDILSVLWDAESGYHVRLTRDAFKG
jgi:putative endonuclease